ncbi:glycosyltransferase [Aestuariibius sp. 2305UL40-4]|uniref:glycosyltransferase n=1 Tax=Aestuariibius violaceus TaxID=3234132 RepID=UPI00345E8002
MKMCFCASTFPSRSQTFVTSQVLYALRNGHEVTVACRESEADAGLSDADVRALEAVRMVRWPPPPLRAAALLPDRLGDRITEAQAAWSWRRQIDADVVVAHFGYRGAAVARAQRGWDKRRPLVTIFHGRDVVVEARRSGLAKYRPLFEDGDALLTVNRPFARMLIDAGAPADRVDTHHLGIPVSRYAFAPRPPGRQFRMVTVCRLVEKKGLSVAIDALARLTETDPDLDWRFDIGGGGPLDADLRAQVAAAGLGARVRFLGPLSHSDTLKHIADADAFLLPSITAPDGDQEGIPVTLMEAMALGTPVCTTRHSGIPELVRHDESGLLSEEGSVDGLASNISRLARSDVDLTAIVRAARAKVEKEFNEERQNAELLARFEALVAQKQRQTPAKIGRKAQIS